MDLYLAVATVGFQDRDGDLAVDPPYGHGGSGTSMDYSSRPFRACSAPEPSPGGELFRRDLEIPSF